MGISQALLGENPLIILDEPTNALDTDSIANLIEMIKKINKHGSTFIIASHDREFLQKITTRQFFVNEGKVNEV